MANDIKESIQSEIIDNVGDEVDKTETQQIGQIEQSHDSSISEQSQEDSTLNMKSGQNQFENLEENKINQNVCVTEVSANSP